eukprot:8308426-Alexandrium_andersonii.AAC.1
MEPPRCAARASGSHCGVSWQTQPAFTGRRAPGSNGIASFTSGQRRGLPPGLRFWGTSHLAPSAHAGTRTVPKGGPSPPGICAG